MNSRQRRGVVLLVVSALCAAAALAGVVAVVRDARSQVGPKVTAYELTRDVPAYTALTQAAYDLWDEIEAESGLRLVFKTGGLDLAVVGTEGEAELATYRQSLLPFGIGSEDLKAAEIRRRWPQWRIDDDVVGLYQEDDTTALT